MLAPTSTESFIICCEAKKNRRKYAEKLKVSRFPLGISGACSNLFYLNMNSYQIILTLRCFVSAVHTVHSGVVAESHCTANVDDKVSPSPSGVGLF